MAWVVGYSWTKSHWEINESGDNVYVHGGPFLYYPELLILGGYRLEGYAGLRSTSPASSGGNEGLWVGFKRLMQKIGWSNLGFSLRFKKI